MAGVNNVTLLGRLGQDPDVRYTPDGKAVATLSIATSEVFKDRDGNRQERPEWHRVVLWERKAEVAKEYLHKGDQAYIEGSIRTRKWTDKDGVERYSTEIIGSRLQLIGGNRDNARDGHASPQDQGGSRNRDGGGNGNYPGPDDDLDDDIPFVTSADMDSRPRNLLARVRF